jgi:hypothetical protein
MKSKISMLISCFTFLFFLSSAYSQTPEIRPGPGMGMRQWKEEPRCWRVSELNLSPNQIKELDLIQQHYIRETQFLRAKLFVKWFELREFLTDPAIKIESIRTKQGEIVELQHKQDEKLIEYLIKLRNLLTQDQLKNWCPEKEFSSRKEMMHRPREMGPMHPNKPSFPEAPKNE